MKKGFAGKPLTKVIFSEIIIMIKGNACMEEL